MRRLCGMFVLLSVVPLGGQAPDDRMIEWPFVGAEQAHTKYSPAAEITLASVDELEVVWQWEVGEMPLPEQRARPGAFQATPFMIDNVLDLSTMYNRVVALDAETGLLYVKTSEGTTTNQVCKTSGEDPDVDVEYSNNCPHGAAAAIFLSRPGGVRPARSQLGGIPLIKPPYSHLVAIDLNAGEIAWKVPFGEGSQILRNHPLLQGVELPERLGTFGHLGSMVTAGGLVFIGGGDPYLYAFDKRTGEEVWRGATPFRTSGNPMSYRARSGRQFVVIPTGAGPDATLVAFARGS